MKRRAAQTSSVAAGVLISAALCSCSERDRAGPASSETADRVTTAATHDPHSPAPLFSDITRDAAVHFTYRNGEEAGHNSILESLGGGVAIFDFDSDGNQDLYLTGGGGFSDGPAIHGNPGALFRNLGGGRFVELSAAANLDQSPVYSHGVAVADYDNDGWDDLLVTGYGRVVLYHNRGDGMFAETTSATGRLDDGWSTSAAWGDLNGDGAVDLFIAHYVDWSFDNHPACFTDGKPDICSPKRFGPSKAALFLNRGDSTFSDATEQAGLIHENAKGLGVIMVDVDADRLLDIYVANDTTDNHLYRNVGDARFEEVGRTFGVAVDNDGVPNGSMGVDASDVNDDGWPDLLVTNFVRESQALYRNESGRGFTHVSQLAGLTSVGRSFVSFGVVFLDLDRDGNEDILIANGHVVHFPTDSTVLQRPLLFHGTDKGRFVPVPAAEAGSYFEAQHLGRGAALGDLDNDGLVDACVSHTNAAATLLRNTLAHAGHFVKVRLIGRQSSRSPVGAIAVLKAGGRRETRFQKGGGSYLSHSEPSLIFGTGAIDRTDELIVEWPSRRRTTLSAPPLDREIVIYE